LHATRVEEAFVAAGAEPTAAASSALVGIRRQYDELAGAIAEPRLRDLFLVSAAVKAEHLEVALYATLVPLARHLGVETGALEQTVAEEREALAALEQARAALLERAPS
jgi:ferritin-like metal-binding protein YciE